MINCKFLSTTADIIKAYRTCRNAGEQIELFENLVASVEPPLEALLELAQTVRLEPILALTLQGLGKIANPHIRENLRQNTDLLAILSQKIQSESTDLIRWSAAITIDRIGFDFVTLSNYLTKEPYQVVQKIIQDKLNRLLDTKLVDSQDYDETVRFWTYGDIHTLRENTVGIKIEFAQTKDEWQLVPTHSIGSSFVCMQVMQNLGLRGIQMVHAALQRATEMGQDALATDENELFEAIALQQSLDLWESNLSQPGIQELLLSTQLLCLQSNNPQTRQVAAFALTKLTNHPLWQSSSLISPFIKTAVEVFTTDSKVILAVDHEEKFVKKIQYLLLHLSRRQVLEDCQIWLDFLLEKINNRKESKEREFETYCQRAVDLKYKLEMNLKKIYSINPQFNKLISSQITFENPPKVSIEDKDYKKKLQQYEEQLKSQLKPIRESVAEFYKYYKDSNLAHLDNNIRTLKLDLRKKILFAKTCSFFVSVLFLTIIVGMLGGFGIIISLLLAIFFSGLLLLGIGEDKTLTIFSPLLESNVSRVIAVEKQLASKRFKIENQQIEVLKLLEL